MNKKVEIKKSNNSEVEIKIEIPWSDFSILWPQALKDLGKEARIDGFRQGHIPEKVLLEKIGENTVLFEMAEMAFRTLYPVILEEEKIDAIGRPEVSITKIAKDNPLNLTVKTAIVPEIKLPDYKKIAERAIKEADEKILVTDEEVEKTLKEIWKQRNPRDNTKDEEIKITDEFAKSLGEFKTVDELKGKVKENMALEKEARLKEKKRIKILEGLDKETKIEIPPLLIDREVEKMIFELRSEIERMGMKFNDYLSHLKKSEDELKESFRENGRKRVATGLIIESIAKTEDIKATDEEINKELEHIKSHNPKVDEKSAKNYLEGVIANEKVIAFLETQKQS